MMTKPVMTTRDVATHMGCSPRRVRDLVSMGYLRPLRGHRNPMRFTAEEVVKYLRGQRA
jgi:predicted site-specific integrase-resolvase